MTKQLIIGLGPGRSGTASLAYFLDQQKSSSFVHEGSYNLPNFLKYTTGKYMPWSYDPLSFFRWYSKLKFNSSNSKYWGDVSISLLPHVEKILSIEPHAKFIYIYRPQELVVGSFLRVTSGVNHWSSSPFWDYWHNMFPQFKLKKRDSVIRHWKEYDSEMNRLRDLYPKNVYIFPISELNTIEGRVRILTACDVNKTDQVADSLRILNKKPNRILLVLIRFLLSTFTFLHYTSSLFMRKISFWEKQLQIKISQSNWIHDSRAMHTRAEEMCKLLIPHLTQNKRIADIGCGTGHIANLLSKKGFNVSGYDTQDINSHSNIEIIKNGIVPTSNNSFDSSLLVTVLHHCDNPIDVLQEALRISKEVIIIEDVYKNKFQKYLTYLMDSVVNLEFFSHPHNNQTTQEWINIGSKLGAHCTYQKEFSFMKAFTGSVIVLEKTENQI